MSEEWEVGSEKTVEKIREILAKDENVRFGYLFGSYADGTFDGCSDVDIAVFCERDDLDMRLGLHHRLQKFLRKEVDLICLNRVKNLFLLESILDGILLKDHKERPYYEVMKRHEIIDYKLFKSMIDAA